MRGMKAETIRLNDIDMYYEIEGEGDPLLLLHGGTGCQENWTHAGRDVLMREYTLIKPDARSWSNEQSPKDDYTPAMRTGYSGSS